jgi:hypothetical protein
MQAGTLFDRLRSVGHVTQEILREARGGKNHIIAIPSRCRTRIKKTP